MLLKHPFEKYKIGSFLQAFGVTKMKQRSKPPPTCSNSSTYHHPEIDPILHFLFAIYQDDLRQVRFATSIPLLTWWTPEGAKRILWGNRQNGNSHPGAHFR